MSRLDTQRRRFIGQAITIGCAVAVPGILSACRREDATAGNNPERQESPGKDSAGANEPSQTTQTSKLSKAQANYQAQSKGSEKCSGCQQFQAESGTCKVVKGDISPNGWCKLWVGES